MHENDELTRLADKILQSVGEEDYALSAIDARKLAKSLLTNGVRIQEDLYEALIKNILENILTTKGKYEVPHCFMTERNLGYIEACEDIQTFLEFLLGNKK
jgi:hypothetical protein